MPSLQDLFVKRPLVLAPILFASCFVGIWLAKTATGMWRTNRLSAALGGAAFTPTVCMVAAYWRRRTMHGDGS